MYCTVHGQTALQFAARKQTGGNYNTVTKMLIERGPIHARGSLWTDSILACASRAAIALCTTVNRSNSQRKPLHPQQLPIPLIEINNCDSSPHPLFSSTLPQAADKSHAGSSNHTVIAINISKSAALSSMDTIPKDVAPEGLRWRARDTFGFILTVYTSDPSFSLCFAVSVARIAGARASRAQIARGKKLAVLCGRVPALNIPDFSHTDTLPVSRRCSQI
jgi:hypothetical protein